MAKIKKLDPEQALLSGIVHNIGSLPLTLKLNTVPALKEEPKIMALVADVVIPKLYPKTGQLIMQSWHFSPDNIELVGLVLIAHQSNQMAHIDEKHIPEQLVASPAFRKFWPDWPTAVLELKEFDGDLKQMKSDISS